MVGREGTIIGMIQLIDRTEGEFTVQDEATLVQLAQLAAVAIENADLYAALLEANRRMDEFLGIASHELRTPLASILLNVQLTRKRLIPVLAQRESREASEVFGRLRPTENLLERAERQIVVLNHLVEDLLDVSKIQAGKLEFRLERCDLIAIVQDAVTEQRAAHSGRLIPLILPPNPPCEVRGDIERLGQVVTNYLTNALKYSTRDKPVEVVLTAEEGRARLAVTDHGLGIPLSEQANIWHRFHRVPGVEVQTGSGVGLGLGLHICHTIIERHGGEVGVQSAPGEGATFWFTVPLLGTISTN
jgi:signal transduction histidine kinase